MGGDDDARLDASFWLDESGTKATAAQCYVVAGIKVRQPDVLDRQIHAVREKHHNAKGELKFGRVNESTQDLFRDVIDALGDSPARLVATVITQEANPFHGARVWEAYSNVVSQLVVGNLNRNETACVFVDRITTPPNVALGTLIKSTLNSRLDGRPTVLACSLDSKASNLLQVADLCAGAIRMQRLNTTDDPVKRRLARRLATAFDVDDLGDIRTNRVNIQSLQSTRRSGGDIAPS